MYDSPATPTPMASLVTFSSIDLCQRLRQRNINADPTGISACAKCSSEEFTKSLNRLNKWHDIMHWLQRFPHMDIVPKLFWWPVCSSDSEKSSKDRREVWRVGCTRKYYSRIRIPYRDVSENDTSDAEGCTHSTSDFVDHFIMEHFDDYQDAIKNQELIETWFDNWDMVGDCLDEDNALIVLTLQQLTEMAPKLTYMTPMFQAKRKELQNILLECTSIPLDIINLIV